MFDISHDCNRFIFPTLNKMSSPRLPQASSDPILHSCVVPGRLRPLVPDLRKLSPRRPIVSPRLIYDVYEFHAGENESVPLVPGSLRLSAVSWDPKIKVWD